MQGGAEMVGMRVDPFLRDGTPNIDINVNVTSVESGVEQEQTSRNTRSQTRALRTRGWLN